MNIYGLSVGDYALGRKRLCDAWEVVRIESFHAYDDYVCVQWVEREGDCRGILNPRSLNLQWRNCEESMDFSPYHHQAAR